MSRPIASVEVPAVSTDLGAGSGWLAVALSLRLRAELHAGESAGIELESRGEGAPGPGELPDDNLLLRAFREGLRASYGTDTGARWRVTVSSMIPASRGLGSSCAAIVAGLLLGASVGRLAPGADELLALAATLEGTPHGVAAALYGGFALAVDQGLGQIPLLRRFRVPEAWIPVVFVSGDTAWRQPSPSPDVAVGAHAASASARAALLTTAVVTSDAGLLRAALDTTASVPAEAGELIAAAYEHGAAGAAPSGGGPSVLAICDSPLVAHSVEKAWNASGLSGMATRLRFDGSGARLAAAEAER